MPAPARDVKRELNKASPADAKAKTGDVMADLIDAVNALHGVVKALVTKLNADAGVTDTNYSAAALKADVKALGAR